MSKSKSRFAGVMDGLQPKPPEDPNRQAKVNAYKDTIVDRDAVALVNLYISKRVEKERLAALAWQNELEIAGLVQLMDASQESGAPGWGQYGAAQNAVRLSSGATVRLDREPSGQVKDKEAYRLWCLANGYDRQMMLWPTKTNEIIKERLVAGEALPDGTEVYSYTKVVLTVPNE